MTAPSHFFVLDHFAHKALFEGVVHVWEVVARLHDYLLQQPLGRYEGTIDERAYLVNPELITIGEGSVVEPGAYIKGPCIIGRNCQVRHGAYIRGDFLAGDGAIIGHATEVKNALFLDGAHAGHFAYVGDSILGNRVNLGAGVKCANLRLDQRPITLRVEGQKQATGLRKLGAIIGDGSSLGCNSVTNPGTLLPPNSFIAACTNIIRR